MSPKILECVHTRKTSTDGITTIEITISYKLIFNANDTNKLFREFNINTYIFKYDKSLYSLDQDITKYITIKKITKFQKKLTTYKIKNAYSCIINGVII